MVDREPWTRAWVYIWVLSINSGSAFSWRVSCVLMGAVRYVCDMTFFLASSILTRRSTVQKNFVNYPARMKILFVCLISRNCLWNMIPLGWKSESQEPLSMQPIALPSWMHVHLLRSAISLMSLFFTSMIPPPTVGSLYRTRCHTFENGSEVEWCPSNEVAQRILVSSVLMGAFKAQPRCASSVSQLLDWKSCLLCNNMVTTMDISRRVEENSLP